MCSEPFVSSAQYYGHSWSPHWRSGLQHMGPEDGRPGRVPPLRPGLALLLALGVRHWSLHRQNDVWPGLRHAAHCRGQLHQVQVVTYPDI